MPAAELLAQLGTVQGLAAVLRRLDGRSDGTGRHTEAEPAELPRPAEVAAAAEFVLEGLHLTRRLAKDVLDDGRVVYGGTADEADERLG